MWIDDVILLIVLGAIIVAEVAAVRHDRRITRALAAATRANQAMATELDAARRRIEDLTDQLIHCQGIIPSDYTND